MEYVNPSELDDAADVLRALAHPVRLRIAAGLLDRGCCVGPMTACLGLPQPQVSQHLAILREAGIVAVQAEGRLRRYEVVHPAVPAIVHALLGGATPAPFEDEVAASG